MNVMTLVEALTGPDGGTWQPFDQVFTLHVSFTECRTGGFPVVLLRHRVGDVSIEVEALITFFPDFLAQQWQAGDSIWSRPAIRVFATYAKWDEKWGYNDSGVAYNDTSAKTFSRGDSDEWTFGAQMEIWW